MAICSSFGLVAAWAVWSAYVAGLQFGERMILRAHSEQPPQLPAAAAAWRRAFLGDADLSGTASAAAPGAVADFTRRLGELQADILRLESRAAQVVERIREDAADSWEDAYALGAPPPLGGPEEAPDTDETPVRALLAAGWMLSARVADRQRQLAVFEELVRLQRLNRMTRPEGWPVRSAYISSGFGDRIDPFTGRRAAHRGIDFAARPGTDVLAVASGIVIWSGTRDGYGKTVEIDHGNGYVTRYAHNSENLVEPGVVVSRGDVIALVGSTGRATGPHLHFEVLQDGRAVSPLRYVEE